MAGLLALLNSNLFNATASQLLTCIKHCCLAPTAGITNGITMTRRGQFGPQWSLGQTDEVDTL